MRIALVNRDIGRGSGTAGYAHALSGWLAGQGHDVVVFASRVHGGVADGVRVRRLPPVSGGTRGARVLARAVRGLDLTSFDVVHALDRVPVDGVYRAGGGAHAAWLAARGAGAIRGLLPRERGMLTLERVAVCAARVVVCNSVKAAADVRRWLGARHVAVIRNGVDAERFRPDADRRRRFRDEHGLRGRVVGFLGHGFERKGLPVAFAAFAAVCGRGDVFAVAGSDARMARWRRRIRDPRVRWLGPVVAPERFLAAVDVLCAPTLYDAGANATLEALATGVPVVASEADGSAEVVPVPEWVVPPRDIGAVSHALAHALEAGDHVRQRCRQVGRTWPVSRNGEAMEILYRELADG